MRERPEFGTRIASALRAGRSTNLNILPESMALQLSRRGTHGDRLFFVQLYRWFPSILPVLQIVRPETLIRWRRAGFRSYWRWTSRNRRGRSQIDMDLRALIGQMSLDNPLWGALRIHGELLKLGFEIAQSTVAKYMKRHVGPPAQSWWMFLRNHLTEIATMVGGLHHQYVRI